MGWPQIKVSERTPYLSVVVTARNDDHGGGLLSRMQAFVNGWIGQCQRHELSSELIVVDWNPPADRPPLMEALQWPLDTRPCQVRFVQVPSEVHRRYKHAEALPLYQMIAKNVGIRRARGRFVLVTNIDIIFSDELVRYIGQQRLELNRMYRIDRHDVMSDVPVDGTTEEQLAYCRTHLIRINAREGTFNLTADGLRALSDPDIADRDSGVTFGAGWYGVERTGPQHVFRWIANDAEVMIRSPHLPASYLVFDLEPGPSAGAEPLQLRALDSSGRVLADAQLRTRMLFAVKVSTENENIRSFRFQVLGGGLPVSHDPRVLNLRAFSCTWATSTCTLDRQPAATSAPLPVKSASLRLMHLINRLAQKESPLQFTLPVSPRLQRLAEFYLGVGGVAGFLLGGIRRYRQTRLKSPNPATATEAVEATSQDSPVSLTASVTAPEFLHTNGCGDFTLMAREHWLDLRGYPEFDMFSFNIDSVLCYAAHHGGVHEEVLQEPMRIYHIEHGTGSGWTPEGQARLFDRLCAKGLPWLDYQELVAWAEQMRRLNSAMIFNRENWGLAGLELMETRPFKLTNTEIQSHGQEQNLTFERID